MEPLVDGAPTEREWDLSWLERFRLLHRPTDRYGLLVSMIRTGVRPNGTADYSIECEFDDSTTLTASIEEFLLIYEGE